MKMCIWSDIAELQSYEIGLHYVNAWLKRYVFNLDLNRESVSEPRTPILHKTSEQNKNSRRAEWDEIHSLTAGGAYGTAAIQCFLDYCCKQSSAALINITLIYIIRRQDKYHLNFSKDSQFFSEIHSYKLPPQLFLDSFVSIFKPARGASLLRWHEPIVSESVKQSFNCFIQNTDSFRSKTSLLGVSHWIIYSNALFKNNDIHIH